MEVDKSIVLTDSVIDGLLDDWFARDGETFLKIRKKGRIGWEETLEKGEAYSAYLLEAPTQEDLIKRAYRLAKEMLVVMDPPFKVQLKITTGKGDSYTSGKIVCVNTAMFDDPELSVGEKLDTFLGVTVHEGCHLLYTNFNEANKITEKVVHYIFNILEDERIEELCGENKPGLANFLEKSKYYYFDQYYLDYVVPKEKEGKMTPFDRLMNCFLHIIRYPKYLKEEEVIEFGHYLLAVKKLVVPYPVTTADTVEAALKIFEVFKDFYEDIEHEKSESESDPMSESATEDDEKSADGSSGSESESSGEAAARALRKLLKDAESAAPALDKVAGKSHSLSVSEGGEGLKESDLAKVVSKSRELLGEICEGEVEIGSSKDSYFFREPDKKDIYLKSLERVRQYIPAISKVLKGHCKEYRLVHRSMRSGVIDTNKLAEAFQGVPTVYMREGEVKTDKVAVCVLIDESGSMCGERIDAARDAAILINEAVGGVPNVELFIYGHSGDIKGYHSTELYVYRENGYNPRYSLGSVKARRENRDGVAVLETAKRVRKQTKNPVLFFILSDGAPCAGGYMGSSAIEHVKQCVQKVEHMGFSVVQVCINHSYDPGRMFKNYVVMENMSTLAVELGKAIKKSTMTTAKVNVI